MDGGREVSNESMKQRCEEEKEEDHEKRNNSNCKLIPMEQGPFPSFIDTGYHTTHNRGASEASSSYNIPIFTDWLIDECNYICSAAALLGTTTYYPVLSA